MNFQFFMFTSPTFEGGLIYSQHGFVQTATALQQTYVEITSLQRKKCIYTYQRIFQVLVKGGDYMLPTRGPTPLTRT